MLTLPKLDRSVEYLPVGKQFNGGNGLQTELSLAAPAEPAPMATAIARAAARLFAERGFDATSVREIAAAAGVTKPTLYYHFGSKQGLGEAIITRPMASLAGELTAQLADESNRRDPVRLLERIFQLHLDFVVADPDRARFVYAICFGPAASSFRTDVDRFGAAFEWSLAEAADRLAGAGVIAAGRVGACVTVCRGLILSTTLDHIYCGRGIGPGLAGRLVGDLLDGFAGQPGSVERRSEG